MSTNLMGGCKKEEVMARTTDLVIAERRDEVCKMLISGKHTRNIASHIREKYGVSSKTVERDITIIYAEIKDYTSRNLDEVLSMHIQRYELVFEKAYEMMDYGNALKALAAIEKLLRMHQDVPLVAIQQNTLSLDGLSTPQIIEAIKALRNEKNESND